MWHCQQHNNFVCPNQQFKAANQLNVASQTTTSVDWKAAVKVCLIKFTFNNDEMAADPRRIRRAAMKKTTFTNISTNFLCVPCLQEGCEAPQTLSLRASSKSDDDEKEKPGKWTRFCFCS